MNCPVCGESSFIYLFAVQGQPAARCQGCGCIGLPAPARSAPTDAAESPIEASFYLDVLHRRGFHGGALLRAEGSVVQAEAGDYDAAILLHQLQAHPSPGDLLERVHAALRPQAPLLLTVPRQWMHGPQDHWCFDETTIQLLLLRYGFDQVLVHQRLADPSRLVVSAVRAPLRARPKISIIVAVFNESNTFPVLMDALLKKEIPGTGREIIIVESHSTDGTHELAQQYRAHPDVKLVLQDRPQGKGSAVREGLRHATGDIVLIQDADLEYDLNDYDALLAPILSHRALFVLGTRHGGAWKMRRFAGQKGLAAALNFGHAFFTGLINILYRQNMTDPFTMFKVFHRDCLFGLEFQCDRFDFDHELVIKLVRKGYRPVEIPVNYSSRSFREGKKVRIFRDPLTWLWVDVKLRFTRVLPKEPG